MLRYVLSATVAVVLLAPTAACADFTTAGTQMRRTRTS
jgi:hypothetical protein